MTVYEGFVRLALVAYYPTHANATNLDHKLGVCPPRFQVDLLMEVEAWPLRFPFDM